MYCNSCGKQIADEAAFCPYCGMPVGQADELEGLVAAARIGDQDAISDLYKMAYNQVYYTIKSMIKDEDAVFDILQDTYIKAFDHLDSFQGDTKFLPWVRQIAANTARDWLKKKRPMLFSELNPGDGQDTPVEKLIADERSENLPEQVIDQQETKRLIREILEELPEDQRAAIGMRYYEELSVKEIAAAMNASESAVKSRLMYGRAKIEKKVRELEKQGTKLYSLSPLPFLLLLFRNQKEYAAEVPDSRILHAILVSRPMGAASSAGAAQGAGTAGAAAGIGAAGAAAAGGLGALKIGLITLATVAAVGLGIFGVTRIVSGPAEPQETSAIENVIDQEESGAEEENSQSAEGTEGEDFQSAEGTEGSEGEDFQTAEEAEEEASFSYMFSDMPIATYEVTGLGVGRFESVNDEELYFEGDEEYSGFYMSSPFVRLTPGENTFVLFCMQGDEDGAYSKSTATIHSPSGSSQWEAITYQNDLFTFYTFGDFSQLARRDTNSVYTTYAYNEETYDGRIDSLLDPWMVWVKFAAIYHPDAEQDDTIYVLNVIAYSSATEAGYDDMDNVLARMINTFEELGATSVTEIPVEEALERCNVVVSKGDAD